MWMLVLGLGGCWVDQSSTFFSTSLYRQTLQHCLSKLTQCSGQQWVPSVLFLGSQKGSTPLEPPEPALLFCTGRFRALSQLLSGYTRKGGVKLSCPQGWLTQDNRVNCSVLSKQGEGTTVLCASVGESQGYFSHAFDQKPTLSSIADGNR